MKRSSGEIILESWIFIEGSNQDQNCLSSQSHFKTVNPYIDLLIEERFTGSSKRPK
jgi:hypothetical protein